MTGRVRAVLVLVATALAGVAACGSSGGKAAPPAPVDLRGRPQVEIDAVQNRFVPQEVIVDVGTTVTWVNKDTIAHNVEKSADALDFGAKFGASVDEFGAGERYSFRFDKIGSFPYTCTIHTLMDGRVQVVAKGSVAPSTVTPTSG